MRSIIMDPTVGTFAGFIVEPIGVRTMDIHIIMGDTDHIIMEDIIIPTPYTARPTSGHSEGRRRLSLEPGGRVDSLSRNVEGGGVGGIVVEPIGCGLSCEWRYWFRRSSPLALALLPLVVEF